MEKYITKKELAKVLGVTEMTVYRLMKANKLPYFKSSEARSGRVLFKESDVKAYLEKLSR